MEFGFLPKSTEEYDFEGLENSHFLALAVEVALQLNWDIRFVSESEFNAFTKFSWSSWGEKITIEIKEGKANIKSECVGQQILDWGKNKKISNNSSGKLKN
jgi:rhomboid protease GluP